MRMVGSGIPLSLASSTAPNSAIVTVLPSTVMRLPLCMVTVGMVDSVWTVTWPLLGSSIFNAFGAISVEVSIKKISSRKTISVIPDMAKLASTRFLGFSAMVFYFAGSFSRSINSDVPASILLITLSTLATREL